MGWLASKSFNIYRDVTAKAVARGFQTQKVYPLEPPDDEHIELVRYDSRAPMAHIPLLYEAANFPRADRAEPRLRRIKAARVMTGVVSALKIGKIAPAPSRTDALMMDIYPRAYQKAWPHPPVVPPELGDAADRLAALAVAGPFADYVHRIRPEEMARINEAERDHVGADAYVIDLEPLARHPVKPGLRPIGCTIVFVHDEEHDALATRSILYQGELHLPGSELWHRVEKIALCSLNTHLSIIKHNIYIHLAFITVHAAAAINTLPSGHPVRRLLHHCFHTALIGNYEIGQFQIRGPDSFCTRLFSFDYTTMIAVINEYLEHFDARSMDPAEDARLRGVADARFAYPFHDNVWLLWEVVRDYVDEYVNHYFEDDAAVTADANLGRWYQMLNERLPGGIEGYVPILGREAVKKLCASLIYTSTVTHDNVNNIVWNYTTLTPYIPTMVPDNDEMPPVDVAFEFLTTIIGTFKPYNMLLDGISSVALDAQGKRIMDAFVDTLRRRQSEMDEEPVTLHTIYPKNLNYSVSN